MPLKKQTRMKLRRATALFLLLTFLNQLVAPNIALALTSGPTAPEATSFEPIDTTDMVNPLTGDFTYNLPLLEVPGPEGGYPLSLSYHAGIQPNEEASWVGLGWTLNPGAISRSVNGFADDFSDVSQTARDYWSGGSRSTFGISVGLPSGVSFGLSFSKDTYQGFGVGASVGFGFGFQGTPLGVSMSTGVDPFGGQYAGMGLNVSSAIAGSGFGLSANAGLTMTDAAIITDGGAGVSYGNRALGNSLSILGASISSADKGVNMSVGGGYSSVHNANAGKIQTQSSGFGFGIPLPGGFSIGISYNYTRYWSDETSTVLTNGSLYMPQHETTQSTFNSRTGDLYRLPDAKNYSFTDYPDPDQVQGGTFPAYDDYVVTAQGLSGNMRPYRFQSMLYSQNKSDIVQTTGTSVESMLETSGVQYRFINDFSNSYRQDNTNITSGFPFTTPTYGDSDGTYGYYSTDNRLAGSKQIVWFSNSQINSNAARGRGFVNTDAAGFIRMGNSGSLTNTKGGSQVGGYMITNASGVTYHYALPAYSYDEYSRTETNSGGYKYTSQTRSEPYAYTWYLTGITGPDYIDKNENGYADDGDWGYWVAFDYGKWTDTYYWRNPSEGFHRDVENNYKSYSRGTREVYYLDAVRTRTHTALFVKQVRADAKSALYSGDEVYREILLSCPYMDEYSQSYDDYGYYFPKASMRLNKILLFKNDQLTSSVGSLRQNSNNYDHSFTFSSSHGCSSSQVVHFGDNVIDKYDISTELEQNCLRAVQFNYDYSLTPGVPNSFDPDGESTYTITPNTAMPSLGKLTLLSVDFLGRGAVSVIPPVEFEYDLDPANTANQDNITLGATPVSHRGTLTLGSATKFGVGDILKFTISGTTYYGVITKKSGTSCDVVYPGTVPSATYTTVSAVKTKNPPYNKDAVDIWGLYKSDYIESTNQNFAHLTSPASNRGTDVWSLRKVKTSLGAHINISYEGDNYCRSVLNKGYSMIITGLTEVNLNTWQLDINTQGEDLNNIFQTGDKIEFLELLRRTHPSLPDNYMALASSSYLGALPEISSLTSSQLTITVNSNLGQDLHGYGSSGGYTPHHETGNLKVYAAASFHGGGTRVRSIQVDNLDGNKKLTTYSYLQPGPEVSATSSGVTSYEPVGLDVDGLGSYSSSIQKIYRTKLYSGMNELLAISREAPAPGVMYEYVTVTDSTETPDAVKHAKEGKTVYQYRVFNRGMIGLQELQRSSSSTSAVRNVAIKDFTSQVGNLLRVICYDTKNNKLTEQINHYSNDAIADRSFDYQARYYPSTLSDYNHQGVIEERFGDGRTFNVGGTWVYKMTMAARGSYPIIQTGTTTMDYKNGTKMEQENLGFDFYNGQINKVLTNDSYGNRFITLTTPAYRKYDEMGFNITGSPYVVRKNMLTQEATSTTYKASPFSNTYSGVISASATTWGTDVPVVDEKGVSTTYGQSTVWRPKASYSWLKEGTSTNNLTSSGFVDFNYSGSSASAWKKTAQQNLYNVFSKSLDAQDINANHAATRFGYAGSKVSISGSPARYDELAFSGAEDPVQSNGMLSSSINPGSGTISTAAAHTGTKSLMLTPSADGFTYEASLAKLDPVRRDYIASVWVKASGGDASTAQLYYKIDGGSAGSGGAYISSSKVAAGWYLIELRIPASAIAAGNATTGTLTVGCWNSGGSQNLYFDDLRVQPVSASAIAYVYNARGEVSHILGNNNLYTKYEYDTAGRLIKVYKEVLGKSTVPMIREAVYNYGKGN